MTIVTFARKVEVLIPLRDNLKSRTDRDKYTNGSAYFTLGLECFTTITLFGQGHEIWRYHYTTKYMCQK